MASLVDYGAALRFVQKRAEAPGQIRAHARILAQCEELLVTVAAALHSRDSADEERAVEEARRLCRLLAQLRPVLERDE